MAHFTDEQIAELALVFGLMPRTGLPVRDGRVTQTCMVWWRSETGPEHVQASEHWDNIQRHPSAYQLAKPTIARVVYTDRP